MGKTSLVAILVLALSSAAYAGWREEASPFDQGRLAHVDQSRDKGLAEAERGASQSALAAIHGVLDPAPIAGSPEALTGTWRCRTMLLGGMTPDRIYSWFRCRISEEGGVLHFEKISGTQRMAGDLFPEGDGFVYLGASWVEGEKPRHYSGSGASVGAPATPDDWVGRLSLIGEGHARIELPYPVQESDFAVIELQR